MEVEKFLPMQLVAWQLATASRTQLPVGERAPHTQNRTNPLSDSDAYTFFTSESNSLDFFYAIPIAQNYIAF